jgi:hypothetical protein
LKVGKTPTSPIVEWGCMDSNHMEGFNNLGMKRVSSLVQRHAPTSSIEDEPTFIEFDEDSEMPNIVSFSRDDSFDGHNNASIGDLHIPGMNGHDNNLFFHWDVVVGEEQNVMLISKVSLLLQVCM